MAGIGFEEYTSGDLEALEYAVIHGLDSELASLVEQYGYIAVYKTGLVLVELGILEGGGAPFIDILSRLSSVTNFSDLKFGTASSDLVYREYSKQKEVLEVIGDELEQSNNDRGAAEQLLNELINEGVKRRASDIHISLTDDQQSEIFFRVDGAMCLVPLVYSKADCKSIIGCCFEWRGADKAEDKNFSFDRNNGTSISGIPVVSGAEKKFHDIRVRYRSLTDINKHCNIRILNTGGDVRTLKELGVEESAENVLVKFVSMADGIVIISGPTGAGKSTLMNAVISRKPKNKLFQTIEDPIESVCSDKLVFQGLQLDEAEKDIAGLMRLDPDSIIVSEIRTHEQVSASLNSSRTGHLVMSTIHAPDSISVIGRLVGLGFSYEELSEKGLIKGLTGQRLVPILCDKCKMKATQDHLRHWYNTASPEAYGRLEQSLDSLYVKKQSGCRHCNNTGLSGRKMVLEYIVVDDKGRQFIGDANMNGWLAHLRDHGWRSMADKSWDFVLNGLADPDAVDGLVPDFLVDSSKPYKYR